MSLFWLTLDIYLTFSLSVLITRRLIVFAEQRAILDLPNERSLHTNATPRGGGIAIAILLLVHCVVLALFAKPHSVLAVSAVALIAILSTVGFWDDIRGLSSTFRFAAQLVAALVVLFLLGYFMEIELGGVTISLGVLGVLVTLIWIVWMTNLYNFMDGVDGIAAVEAITGSVFMALWFYWVNDYVAVLLCCAVIGAVLGFSLYNWAPAKIFMGDVGSLTLGGLFAVLALWGVVQHGLSLIAFVMLFGVFIADTTITLIIRIIKRESWWRAHRTHFFQRAVRSGMSHADVSIWVGVTTISFGVFATLLVADIGHSLLWLFCVLVVLCWIALRIKQLEDRSRVVA